MAKKHSDYLGVIKRCAKKKDLYKGDQLHAHIQRMGILDECPHLATALITMYAACGALLKAHQVLDELQVRNVISWSALIFGYAQNGQGNEALMCFQRLRIESLFPNAVTFICSLKACVSIGAVDRGKYIHFEIVRRSLLQKDIVLGTALVNLYAKSGVLSEAQKVLDQIPVRNVVCWSALIAGYTQQGQGHEALNCFEQMLREGISPDAITFTCILSACGNIGDVDEGKRIHHEIVTRGFLDRDIVTGNALVDMYLSCGVFAAARCVLEKLHERNVVSWNTLITGYTQCAQCDQALKCFEEMQMQCVTPNRITFLCSLEACGRTRSFQLGKQLHNVIVNCFFLEKDNVLCNAVIDMYAKCGMLEKAKQVLDHLGVRDEISWTALISGYAQQGQGHQALECFKKMCRECVYTNAITLSCILSACATIGATHEGEQIHQEIVLRGLLKSNMALGNSLMNMYVKCGNFLKSREVFDELSVRDVISWNTLIAGYTQKGHAHNVMQSFEEMQEEGVYPNGVTFTSILKACGIIGAIETAKHIHNEVVIRGLIEECMVLGNAVVDLYAKYGIFEEAKRVLIKLPIRDTSSWNALIAGYVQHGQGHQAMCCLNWMQREDIYINHITLICISMSCGIYKGKQIHNDLVSRGSLDGNVVLQTSIINMYAKLGHFDEAQYVLDNLHVRDVVNWNSLISGYTQHGKGLCALKCYEQMQREHISPDLITYTCLLKACGSTSAISVGKQIHTNINNERLSESDFMIGNALVDLYARTGDIGKAEQVFRELPFRDVVSYSTLITGYSHQGQVVQAVRCFEQMQREGISPDVVAILCVLNAYGMSGLVEEGRKYFDNIQRKFGILPNIKHHTSMVHAFGCAGCFGEALTQIKEIKVFDSAVRVAVLSACYKSGNLKLARLAFK